MVRHNDDKELVQELKRKIEENDGYCPCAFVKTKETRCPCLALREYEECECGLYVKHED